MLSADLTTNIVTHAGQQAVWSELAVSGIVERETAQYMSGYLSDNKRGSLELYRSIQTTSMPTTYPASNAIPTGS